MPGLANKHLFVPAALPDTRMHLKLQNVTENFKCEQAEGPAGCIQRAGGRMKGAFSFPNPLLFDMHTKPASSSMGTRGFPSKAHSSARCRRLIVPHSSGELLLKASNHKHFSKYKSNKKKKKFLQSAEGHCRK